MFHIFPLFVSQNSTSRIAATLHGVAAIYMHMTTVTLCDKSVNFEPAKL